MNAKLLKERERESPQQYGDWRHGLREQMQTLRFVQAILQPMNASKVIYHAWTTVSSLPIKYNLKLIKINEKMKENKNKK